MRIVVCVKQVAHTYARTGMDPEQYYLSPQDQVYRVNPCDELAVGMALKAKKLAGEGEICSAHPGAYRCMGSAFTMHGPGS